MLLENIIEIAREEKIECLLSQMFEDNVPMKNLCKELGFKFEKLNKQDIVIAKLKI